MHTSFVAYVYSFQLKDFPVTAGEDDENNANALYFQIGDWHDTYFDKNQKGGGPVTLLGTELPIFPGK